MTEKPKLQRGKRTSQRGEKNSELTKLRSRVASQEQEIEELRREVDWLSEELFAQEEASAPAGGVFTRGSGDYGRMTRHVRRVVHECVPRGSSLGVVSSGDESLLRYVGCKAEHLSQDQDGLFTEHPTCARAAVVQLEAARWRGAEFLVIPENGLWWLEHYGEFGKHLDRKYTSVYEDDLAAIWDLRSPCPLRQIDEMLADLSVQSGHQPVVLDWHTGEDLAASFPDYKVFSPLEDLTRLPYLDHSVEVVVIRGTSKRQKSREARRVASDLVIGVGTGSPPKMDVLWRSARLAAFQEDVSVLAVSRDHRPLSVHYVRRLFDSLPMSFSGELIVGMDRGAVVPQLGPEAERLKRIKVIPFREDDGFATGVRQAAEAAKGEALVVVDGSTRPVTGWLPPLVRLLREPGVGAATGVFVEPDGRPLEPRRLPESNDAPAPPASDDLDAAHRRYVRSLDFVPESLFATKREHLLESDLDAAELGRAFASQLQARGLGMLYQPETLAISEWTTAHERGIELESVDG